MNACGRLAVCAGLAVPVVALSVVPSLQFDHWPWICLTLAAPAVVAGGLPLHLAAARALRHGVLDDDVPALLGIVGALAWSIGALLLGPAGDPGWTQAFPPGAAAPPVRLDVAAAITVLLLAAALRSRVDDPLPPRRCWRVASRIAVPLVLAVAAGTLGYRLGGGDDVVGAAAATAAVLLVAAPSAFRPRPPRRADRVERRVDTVLFTSRALTGGPRRIDAVHATQDTDDDEVLRLAGSVAERSAHPAAVAVAAAAAERCEVPSVGEFDERPGLGASGIVAELHPGDAPGAPDLAAVTGPAGRRADGTAVTVVAHAVLLGRPDLLAGHGIALQDELRTACDGIETAGHTAVAVAWDGRARAVLAVATDVPQDAATAVDAVRRSGMAPALLSARPVTAATAVAERAGIDPGPDTVLAGVRPDGEADAVARLRGSGHVVAVVGVSGRDDDALAAADLALTVGTGAGSAAAAVAALRRRRRAGPARWTGVAAAAYHLVALPAAASGMIDPLFAGLAGALVTVASTHRPGRGRQRCASAVTPVTGTGPAPLGDAPPSDRS